MKLDENWGEKKESPNDWVGAFIALGVVLIYALICMAVNN